MLDEILILRKRFLEGLRTGTKRRKRKRERNWSGHGDDRASKDEERRLDGAEGESLSDVCVAEKRKTKREAWRTRCCGGSGTALCKHDEEEGQNRWAWHAATTH